MAQEQHPLPRRSIFAFLLFLLALLIAFSPPWRPRGQGNDTPVTTISAASFTSTVAPGSIASAFGVGLATSTVVANSLPLPTELAGTTVRVNGEAAPLFFVSPSQVNYLIPSGTPAGVASIVINAGDGMVATGTAQVAAAAPALFTANADGRGALASLLLRVKANGEQSYEPLAQFDETQRRLVTRPIDFGAEGDQLFLILYLTGVGQATTGSVRVVIGGVEYAPTFVGAQGGFAGLDQINLALPRNFGGRGQISLFVKVAGGGASNACELEIGGAPATASSAPVQLTGVSSEPVLAGEEIEVSGSGFAANARENQAQIVSDGGVTAKADVLAADSESLRLRIPFGAGTGQLKVIRGQAEDSLAIKVRTSVSGFVEEARRQADGSIRRTPIEKVTIRVRVSSDKELTAITNADGSFVLPDVPESARLIFIVDGATAQGTPSFSLQTLSLPVSENRDNKYPSPIELRRRAGPDIPVGGANVSANHEVNVAAEVRGATSGAEQIGQLILTLPPNAVVRFPDGSTGDSINVTSFEPGRTPTSLPSGHFSSTIAQLAPFGATITPGGKLTFPNSDAIAVGAQPRLFKFDQTAGSPTLGQFIDVGAATVTADGQRVETAANAITETSYYFVSIPRPLAAINGRVVESDGRPVPRAIVQARGQATFTDGFGGFVLRNVPMMKASGDRVRVEVSYQRPDGRIARKDSSEVELMAGALATVKPDIVLDAVTTNFPPVILGPATLTLEAGETRAFDFVVTDPDSARPPDVKLDENAPAFAILNNQGQGIFRLQMAPGANAVGSYTLNLTATDGDGAQSARSVNVTVNHRGDSQPVAQAQAVTLAEDTRRAITLLGRDPGGQPLSYKIVSGPARGSLSGTAPNLTYTPAPNFNGADSFTFKVSNGVAESAAATIFIAVSPVNDIPQLNLPPALEVNAGEALNLVVSAIDVDGETAMQFRATGLPPGATFVPVGGTSSLLSWTPTYLQAGVYSLNITVTDSGGLEASRTLTLTAAAKWAKTSGPEEGVITAFTSAGGALYAGTSGGGVYRSSDNGQSWTAANNGLTGLALDVEVLHAVGGKLFAGTLIGGVYRWSDNEQSWTAANNGLTGFALRVHALHAAGGNLFTGTSDGVYRSSDNGQNWTAVNNGLTGSALSVQALRALGGNLFAGTAGGGVYRSSDNGQSWTAANDGLTGGALRVRALHAVGGNLFAGTGDGVYRSSNNGQNWTAVNNGLMVRALEVRALQTVSGNLFAGTEGGVYRSSDNGQNWTATNNGLPFQPWTSINALHAIDRNLFAGTYGGVYRSQAIDAGVSWLKSSAGISASVVFVILHNGNDLFASTRAGLSISSDGGQSWSVSNSPKIPLVPRALLAMGSNLFAGTSGRGVYRSSDNGQSWTAASNGLMGDALFVRALQAVGGNLFAGTLDGVYRSSDNGQSWTAANNGLQGFVNVIQVVGGNLFAGTSSGVYRSSDNGQSWTAANNGLQGFVNALQTMDGNLFAGTSFGVYRSSDNGQSWTATGLFNNDVNALQALGGNLFAGTREFGVYRSGDNGQNWTAVNNGLSIGLSVHALQAVSGNLFAGTDVGVYRSSDNGQSWTAANNGLPGRALSVAALHAAGGDLFAMTNDGVYRSGDNGQSWTETYNALSADALFVRALHAVGGNLFAGTSSRGVYRSSDNGQSWTAANNGLPADVRALQAVGGNLFAATGEDGVYRSSDNGQSWTAINNGLMHAALVPALHVVGGNLFAATWGGGVYRWNDNGQSWMAANNGLTGEALFVNLLHAVGSNLFAMTNDGLYRLSDNAGSWTKADNGLPTNMLAVFALQAVGDNLFAGTYGGVYRSSDSGQSWALFSSGLTQLDVRSLASDGAQLFAGTYGYGVSVLSDQVQSWREMNANLNTRFINTITVSGATLFAGALGGGVFRSSDQGQMWLPASAGLPSNANVQSLVADGAALWAGVFGAGVYRSNDQGASWTAINAGLGNLSVNKLFLSGATLYAGTDNGVFRSTNGASWTAFNSGLGNQRVVSFTLTNGALYAGTDSGGVFRLDSSGGASWTPVNRGLSSLAVMALGANGNVLYAGTRGAGIYISRDGGANWTPVNNQLPSNLDVFAFAMSGRKVYAGSIYGTFVTENEGQSWKQINAGLLNTFVTGLAVSGDQLFASTASGGVFVSRIPQQ